MSFQWDDQKARENLEKHGLPFEVAVEVFRDVNQYEYEDDRYDYDER